MLDEDEVTAVEEVDSAHVTKGTQTFGKKMEAIKEPSEEGEASTPNKVSKIGHREDLELPKRRSELASTSRQLTNYTANAKYADYGGLLMMRRIHKKGIQVLQPFDPSSSGKSRRCFRQIGILV